MNRMLALLGLAAMSSLLALGCSGAGSEAIAASLGEEATVLQALSGADGVAAETTQNGERRGKRGAEGEHGKRGHMGFGKDLMKSDCATMSGNPGEGGSVALNDCAVPGGTLTGTISWSAGGGKDLAEGQSFSKTTAKEITFTRDPNAEKAHIPELGMLRKGLDGQTVIPDSWQSAQITSNITMSGVKGDREAFSRTGTTTINIYDGGQPVSTINITWNGDKSVTVNANGQITTLTAEDLRQFHGKHKGGEKSDKQRGDRKERKERPSEDFGGEATQST